MIKFTKPNNKLSGLVPFLPKFLKDIGVTCVKPKLYAFPKLAGHTCPYAKDCKSMVKHKDDGKAYIVDGKDTLFRCYSASSEALYPNVFRLHQNNSQAIASQHTVEGIRDLILQHIPQDSNCIRVHTDGDFTRQIEFDAWLDVARIKSNVLFYAYTKSLPYWVKRINDIPNNFILTASYGGRKDNLIAEYGLRYTKVVKSISEAKKLKLTIDHYDTCAADPKRRHKSFALLIHGMQPANSEYGKAVKKLAGLGSYGG